MKVSADQYAEICDVIFRAMQGWPLEESDENAPLHTSGDARAAASKVLAVLGLELENAHEDRSPEWRAWWLRRLAAYKSGQPMPEEAEPPRGDGSDLKN